MEVAQEIHTDKQTPVDTKMKHACDTQMSSSIVSVTSSLTSPVDSGVQLLDSESEMTSVMSASGIGCDIDAIPNLENDEVINVGVDFDSKAKIDTPLKPIGDSSAATLHIKSSDQIVMTKSDIVNQNVMPHNLSSISASVPNSSGFDKLSHGPPDGADSKNPFLSTKSLSDEVFESQKPNTDTDLMNVSLNSYELLDYTDQNSKSDLINQRVVDPMHVSMSEEALKTESEPQPDEQIVFRRQRKKKSKSDTPKKRVSFHEDILNSTKIDDIHINHGFITHESDISFSFFQNGFIRKPDVVKGRYSWAAEGDAPYYQRPVPERQVKSDIYIHHPRFSSTSSSSSSNSISSSIDEEEPVQFTDDVIKELVKKKPKSSCLKKTKHKKIIDTNIVEEVTETKKKAELSLLDANIFGSLKNILNFSTSVPLAERGVPEGQEDVTVYSSSQDASRGVTEVPVKKAGNLSLDLAKTNLKLTKSEGFYPNYPVQNLPQNILVCDSNVYEHKGISYSYEYDEFKKTFEQKNKPPKSSTIYQMILKEFNFFKKKATQEPEPKEELEAFATETDNKFESTIIDTDKEFPKVNLSKYASSSKLDWSDNDTLSDYQEAPNPRHLNSPKRKAHKSNHYSIQPFKPDVLDTLKPSPTLRAASSKTSLINRFLRNVTVKKMLDLKAEKRHQFARRYMSLYVKGGKRDESEEARINREIEEEVLRGRRSMKCEELQVERNALCKFSFRSDDEILLRIYPVKSAYTTSGENDSLVAILTNSSLYIAGFKPNSAWCNHFVLPYADLNTIMIGPDSQTIHFSNYDKDMQCLIVTGCMNVTKALVGQLEVAIRRDVRKPKLPAVKQLCMRDMANLRRAICKQTSIDKDEEYFYYTVIDMQDFNSDASEIPLGPTKEGPLMFKISKTSSRWETAYFILKAGILYMLSSALHKVPMRVFPLVDGACQGARRVRNSMRPHTFQVVVDGTVLYLAAPDEYAASEWLQALVHAASGTSVATKRVSSAQSCSLLMSTEHVLLVREALPGLSSSTGSHRPIEGPKVLSSACISDITAFRLPSAEHSWCVLEFACREVHESSGDWILYFSTNAELERFISTLELLWAYQNEQGECFPLSTIPEVDSLNKKCMDVYNGIRKPWFSLPLNCF